MFASAALMPIFARNCMLLPILRIALVCSALLLDRTLAGYSLPLRLTAGGSQEGMWVWIVVMRLALAGQDVCDLAPLLVNANSQ